MFNRKILKTALLYGEGTHEYIFFNFLLKTKKFKALEKEWFIDSDHASGSSCKDILNECIKVLNGKDYDVVLCFIDTDDLEHDFPNNYDEKKEEYEKLAAEHGIEIVWQDNNLESVLSTATDGKINDKTGSLKKKLKKNEVILLRSLIVKYIFHKFFSK